LFFVGILLPGPLWAHSDTSGSIGGEVKDSSGSVLPGVTVEASSPALIEKVRSVVTDGQGRYNIVDLRPGTYSVIFMLPGLNTQNVAARTVVTRTVMDALPTAQNSAALGR
jgi:hypothetical protein